MSIDRGEPSAFSYARPGIFAFPRGAKAGTFLHDVFEHLDFTDKPPAIRELVAGKLREYGLEDRWAGAACEMIDRVLSVSLFNGQGDFRLSRLGSKDRLSEMEFYFPLRQVSPEKLKQIFARHGGPHLPPGFPQRIETLNFQPARGFMKGFIDLTFQFQERFYLVDWKSNFLGDRIEDYRREHMAEEMEENFYILQYHLYALALHQYLKIRLPGYAYGKHFGGVFYVFLRGVDPQGGSESGIYRDRPEEELIESLSAELISLPIEREAHSWGQDPT